MSTSFNVRRKPGKGKAAESAPLLARADSNKPLPPLPVEEPSQSSSQAFKPAAKSPTSYNQTAKPALRTGKDIVKAAGLRRRVTPTRVLPCVMDYPSADEGSPGSDSGSSRNPKDMFISPNCYFGSVGNVASPTLWNTPVNKELADPRYRIMLDEKWKRVMPVPPPGLFFTKW